MWGDADTAIGGNRDRFPSAQLSLIEAAAGEPLAMERVLALYWKPVYKFIRLKFQDNESAKDLTQGFFASALERDFFQRFDPSKAGFRTYLRLAFAFAVAAMPSETGHHYLEIMAPGFVVGAIVGFLTQKMGTPAPVKRSS